MLVYLLYKFGMFLSVMLPIRFSFWLGSRIADIHFARSPKDRAVIAQNIMAVTGEKDPARARIMAREVMRNFAKYLVEFLRFSRMNEEYIKKNVIIEGAEHLKEALSKNRGAIAFSAHLGNWEWGGALVSQLGYSIHAIAWAHKNKMVNDFFVNQRALGGMGSILLGGSVRRSLSLLKKNEIIAILPDKDFSNNSVKVDFFGRPAHMPVGIGLLALMSKAALVPVFVTREKDGRHKLVIEKPLDYDLVGDKGEDVKNIVQKAAHTIEKYVKMYPEQWFMFDNPWAQKSAT
jgi:KDO2-lipid IV(A) lauroyltransferase